MITALLVCAAALLLDQLLGEPHRAHPLMAFGRLAQALEGRLNRPAQKGNTLRGGLAAGILLLPPVLLAGLLAYWLEGLYLATLEILLLYLAIGLKSLADHAKAVVIPLKAGELDKARSAVAMMVSRDTKTLDGEGLSRAATESVLENGSDAVMASLFWYLVGGLPGLLLHRLANTLDAMWGYRNERFNQFGRFAARLDDLLGFLPARLTALAYALAGQSRAALRAWWRQGHLLDSPNAGPVMASGAGALGLSLGGSVPYGGKLKQRPDLGVPRDLAEPVPADAPEQAVRLLRRATIIGLLFFLLGVLVWSLSMGEI